MNSGRWILGGIVVVVAAAAVTLLRADAPGPGAGSGAPAAEAVTPTARPQEQYMPRFTDDGKLMRPEGWQAWVLAGTSMGLTYNERPRTFAPGEAPGSFLNVYIQPWAYDAFMRDGEFAQGTMFILAASQPVSKADPARGGFYQGDLSLLEVHLKQDGIDPTGWAFFGYGGGGDSAEQIASDASCYVCHSANADHDNAFVQFYPMMRERLGLPDPTAEAATDPSAAPAGPPGAADTGD